MNTKKWLLLWTTNILFLLFISFFLMSKAEIPLRFSSSISYDAKLNFLQQTQRLGKSDTLIVGSSMALLNVNGIFLEKESKAIDKVINLASWGLQSTEVLQLIKLIDLKNVKQVIYSSQYVDFQEPRLKNIDGSKVEKYLQNQFTLYPYVQSIKSILPNLKMYFFYKETFLNSSKYSYLKFDKTGSINLTLKKHELDSTRWINISEDQHILNEQCFSALVQLNTFLQKRDIQFTFITTPILEEALKNRKIASLYDQYLQTINLLSEKHHFSFVNVHEKLHLSKAYFIDIIHLNKKGATKVSQEIIKILK